MCCVQDEHSAVGDRTLCVAGEALRALLHSSSKFPGDYRIDAFAHRGHIPARVFWIVV